MIWTIGCHQFSDGDGKELSFDLQPRWPGLRGTFIHPCKLAVVCWTVPLNVFCGKYGQELSLWLVVDETDENE